MQQWTAILDFLQNHSDTNLKFMEWISEICEKRGYKNSAYNSILDILMASNKSQIDMLQILIEMEKGIIEKA